MIKELRIGNNAYYKYWNPHPTNPDWGYSEVEIVGILKNTFYFKSKNHNRIIKIGELHPIPLSEDILLRLGFEKPSTYTVVLTYSLNLGRKRSIAVSAVGTPNEMVFIREGEGNEKDDLIVFRNYDYDGKTHLHHIQNIAFDFGTELTLNP